MTEQIKIPEDGASLAESARRLAARVVKLDAKLEAAKAENAELHDLLEKVTAERDEIIAQIEAAAAAPDAVVEGDAGPATTDPATIDPAASDLID